MKILLKKVKYILKSEGLIKGLRFLLHKIKIKFIGNNKYQRYLAEQKIYIQKLQKIADQEIAKFSFLPTFSVVMPVYDVDEKWLRLAIESVQNQIYPHWELCIADDASPSLHIRLLLTEYSAKDPRIKVVFREKNGNISAASNSALELATGDFIALLDHDDELTPHALFENAKLLNFYPDADFIYSDEDKINTAGNRFEPFFKPDWSPDYFQGCMYTCHLGVYRSSFIKEIGGFRSQFDGAQDYDLVLRITEKTSNIYHIPKILYHWRTLDNSEASENNPKPWAHIAAQNALQDMLENSRYKGEVEMLTNLLGRFRVRRTIIGEPLISIVIPSAGKTINTEKGSICLLENCINSINEKSSYRNFEIIIVDGFDIDNEYLNGILSHRNIKLVRSKEPFNFSQRINLGVAKAQGEFILILNDDIEVMSSEWLNSMLELSQIPEIGAVGAKLFFPNGKLQHVGVTFPKGLPGHIFYECHRSHGGYFCSNLINKNYLAVTGACLMIRRETFYEVGCMDESLPLNFNDIDFCLKLHRAGYRNVFTPFAELIHYESATRLAIVDSYEIEYLQKKWADYFEILGHDPYYNPNFSKDSFNFELP
jgi:glycosyltransferase involved in cell wall biosynthesis